MSSGWNSRHRAGGRSVLPLWRGRCRVATEGEGWGSRAAGRALAVVLLAVLALVACDGRGAAVGPAGDRAEVEATSGCQTCHADPPAGVHAAVPCTGCHLGDGVAASKEAAHAGMEAEAGALDTVDHTCGTCHPAEVATVRTVPMATGRGIVGVDRFVFGEIPTPDTIETLADTLATPTPAQEHLRKLCAGCHLGTRKANRDDAVTGGSGCGACHAGPVVGGHSTVDTVVADARCQGCHSRSARISLTYAGLAETGAVPAGTLPDGRAVFHVEPDLHAAAGLGCIDCHGVTDLMGDGTSRAHQDEQVEVRCESCHAPVPVRWADTADAVDKRLGRLRAEDDIVATGIRGTPLWNVVQAEGTWRLTGKLDGRDHVVPIVAPDHAGPGHARLTCAACHAAVAPTCTGCHTSRDPNAAQWDFGLAAETPGAWVEAGPAGTLAPPALGVGADGQIRPAIPGMIATIDNSDMVGIVARASGAPVKSEPPANIEVRRFALLDPHATRRPSRSCVDCHRSAVALGLGTGALDVETLRFTPARPVAGSPGLADDGWTTLLAVTPGVGTRVGARSLDASEQRRVLRVGVCLQCHAAMDPVWGAAPRPERCTLARGWWDIGIPPGIPLPPSIPLLPPG